MNNISKERNVLVVKIISPDIAKFKWEMQSSRKSRFKIFEKVNTLIPFKLFADLFEVN